MNVIDIHAHIYERVAGITGDSPCLPQVWDGLP